MRVLITGGAGFIGSNLARAALAEGHEIVVLDDLSTGYAANLDGLPVRFHEGSVNDRDTLDAALEDVGAVVHLAALGSVPRSILDPVATHHANATGTLSVLEGARRAGVGHVVTSSSSSVYGLNPALPKSEREWLRPLSPYAVSKLAGEQYLLAYQQSFGLETLAFRFFNVYGPRQRPGHAYAAVVPVFLDAMLRGQPVPVHGDGLQSRDFTFVGTVCAVLLDAVARRVSHPEPVNLAFGTNTTVVALVEELEGVSGLAAEVVHEATRPGDVRASQADNRVLMSLFPSVEPVPLRDGLTETLAWFKEHS
jgi:UDP-glucose 4-epimerase